MNAYRTSSPIPPISGSARVNVGMGERLVSVAGGVALAYAGLKKMSTGGVMLALTGGALLFRGLTGYCPVNAVLGRDTAAADAQGAALDLTTALTVQQPRADVYRFWRHLENLPRFMEHLREVRQLDARRSHWVADVPGAPATLEWDALLVAEEENSRLAWRSVPDSDVDNAGEVIFRDAPGARGTEVEVRIAYRPPAGSAGRGVARLLSPVFEQMVKEDLRRFKHVLEAGEIPSTAGQPSGHNG